jgi:hypothetical protein
MLFKYSNIVIRRFKKFASFGLMHLIGTSIAFWFGSLVDEAIDFYVVHNFTFDVKNSSVTESIATSTVASASFNAIDSQSVLNAECSSSISPSISSSMILPYMYPFSIEFNLCLAVLWFTAWKRIGSNSDHSDPHPFSGTIIENDDGNVGKLIDYESNLVIHVDCHASNKGLFSGMFVLIFCLITMFMFFFFLESFPSISRILFHTQESLLTTLLLFCSIVCYRQMEKFDLFSDVDANKFKPSTDAVLLMIPIPFFITSHLMSIVAEASEGNYFRVILLIIITFQTIFQTVFIMDALNRILPTTSHRRENFDSNLRNNTSSQESLTTITVSVIDEKLDVKRVKHLMDNRLKKPGRELITLSLLLNISSWIVYTFESKGVESFLTSESSFFGESLWMIVSHVTLPLMLFYRFHASVCLADVWKEAYVSDPNHHQA